MKTRGLQRDQKIPGLLLLTVMLCAPSVALHARSGTPPDAIGLLWSLQGQWHHGNGKLLKPGDAIRPGELLQPSITKDAHAALVLLPDGQRLLYQCFNPSDCTRGFRVPSLNSKPTAFDVEILTSMRIAFPLNAGEINEKPPPRTVPAVDDEMLAVVPASGQVVLTGLAATLPAGHYTYSLFKKNHSADGFQAIPPTQSLEKKDGPARVAIPAPGVYEIRIADAFNQPRINLFLVATRPDDANISTRFKAAKDRLKEWNDGNAGWPMHQLLRLYLLSLTQTNRAAADQLPAQMPQMAAP